MAKSRNRGDRFPEPDVLVQLRSSPLPGDWAERGLCRKLPASHPRVRVRIFFPGRGAQEVADDIAALCARCPVLESCRAYALRYPVLGTWAGMTHDERVRWRRDQRKEAG